MPDDANNQNNQNNQNNNSTDPNDPNSQQNNQQAGGGKYNKVILGCDSNNDQDSAVQDTVYKALTAAGYQTQKLSIGPNDFANYSYGSDASGNAGVYLMAASLISYLDAADAGFAYNVLGIRGDVTGWSDAEWAQKPVPQDHDGNYSHRNYDKCAGMTYPQLNEMYKGRCVAVPGETPEKLAQNIVEALGGQYTGASSATGGGGAQVKDKTFEKCIRRICAATDSIFLIENNAAVLFPYTDWMAFTLRQKISEIKSDEIDPDVFSMEYGNDGFYNKVSIAWGGATLPERYPSKKDGKKQVKKDRKQVTNYTVEDILENMRLTNFSYKEKTIKKKAEEQIGTTVDKNKKEKTTQIVTVDDTGTTMLSEQYDSLVDRYGEMEKRVESAAPDFETAQYIVNALLIQYVRDFNNSCKCRALGVRKYIGGTFYAVENPNDKTSELFYLNGYTIRTQKGEPLYHDLDFKYGPEGAEEILDYQTLSGGAAAGGTSVTGDGSADEVKIWTEGAKIHYAHENSTENPEEAWKMFGGKEAQSSTDCYGMSAYLYYRFNHQAGIPCRVVGDSGHHVVMLYKNNQWKETRDEYRSYGFEYNFKWRGDQNTSTLLEPPGNVGSTSGGNTNQNNTNSGNAGGN